MKHSYLTVRYLNTVGQGSTNQLFNADTTHLCLFSQNFLTTFIEFPDRHPVRPVFDPVGHIERDSRPYIASFTRMMELCGHAIDCVLPSHMVTRVKWMGKLTSFPWLFVYNNVKIGCKWLHSCCETKSRRIEVAGLMERWLTTELFFSICHLFLLQKVRGELVESQPIARSLEKGLRRFAPWRKCFKMGSFNNLNAMQITFRWLIYKV